MKIGLLEDSPTICECITAALELVGHTVSVHTSGESLLKALSAGSATTVLPYDLLIIDLNLPGDISGQDVVMRIRSTASEKQLPILIVSAASNDEIAAVKARFPSIPVLRKPFELRSLFQLIQHCYNES